MAAHVSLEESIIRNDPDYLYTCTKCKVTKPNREYSHSYKPGLSRQYLSQCKACRNIIGKSIDKAKKNQTAVLYRKRNRLKHILNASIGNSKKKNLKHDLTLEYLEELLLSQNSLCFYTGKLMDTNIIGKTSNLDSVSIDRLDSKKGYTKDNVVLCRWVVNRMKNELSVGEMLEIVNDIIKTHANR